MWKYKEMGEKSPNPSHKLQMDRFTINGKAVDDSLQLHIERLFEKVKPSKREILPTDINSVENFYEMEVNPTFETVALNARTNRLEKQGNEQTEKKEKTVKPKQVTNSIKRYLERVEI